MTTTLAQEFDFLPKTGRPASSGKAAGQYPFFTSSAELSKWTDSPDCEGPALVFGTGGSASLHYVERPFSASNDCYIVRPKTGKMEDAKFYYHFLRTHMHLIEEGFRGAGLKHVTKKHLEKLVLPQDHGNSRSRIISILERADGIRRKREKSIQLSQSLLCSYYAVLFERRDWLSAPLADVVANGTIVTYGIVQAGEEFPGGVPYIRTGDIKDGAIKTEGLRHTDPKIAAKFARSRVSAGDIVMSIRATVGTTAVVPASLDGANLTQGTARIAPGTSVTREYLLSFLRSDRCQRWIEAQVKGATFREITLKRLRELNVPLPPLSLQLRFSQFAQSLEEQIAMQRNAHTAATEFFLSLSQRAFRGEL